MLKKIQKGFRYITTLLCAASLWVMPSKLSANGYEYSDNNCCEYQECQSSGFTKKDALVIGAAAVVGGVAGALLGKGKKGERGSDGSSGSSGSDGNDFTILTGPAQLTFAFHTGAQTAATGTLRGVITLPDQSFQTVELPFNTTDNVGTIVIGPPSEQGEYTITIHIHTLTGTLNTAPSATVTNSLNSETSAYTAALPQAVGQQSNFSFVYDTFLLP